MQSRLPSSRILNVCSGAVRIAGCRHNQRRLTACPQLPQGGNVALSTGFPPQSLASSANITFRKKKVAIVGSGCAGIAALWSLQWSDHDVYIYEAADRLGGHTNTVNWQNGKYTTKVDTGFIVLNTATYRESA